MTTTLTKIGNSQGIRIPKPLIKQAHLENTPIDFELTEKGLLLKPLKKPRKNWEENIKNTLKTSKKDEGIIKEFLDENLDEWEW